MKKICPVFLMSVSLFLIPMATVWTQETASTKPSFTGNQLQSSQVPKTQMPATILGGVPGVTAPKTGSLLVLQRGSALYLMGDSTLHKFEMGAKALFGSAALRVPSSAAKAEGGLLKAIKAGEVESMDLTVPVTYLKSKEKGLDENAYKALAAKENPEIKFALESATLAPKDVMTAKGKLTIAGTTVPVTLTAEATFTGNQVRLKGVQKIRMSDYKVKPPSISLLVTSIDVMDDLEVRYDVIFGLKD